ncbi:hypothetical protein PAMA_020345 [Pampus argenteus]
MSSALVVCEVDQSLKDKLRKFRFRKETNNAAILMKIDMEKQLVILEEEYEDISLDALREELPERQPRHSLSTATNMSMLMVGCLTLCVSYSQVQWDVSPSNR